MKNRLHMRELGRFLGMLGLGLPLLGLSPASPPQTVQYLAAPEREVPALTQELMHLAEKVKAVPKVSKAENTRINLPQAQILLATADRNFAEKKYWLAISGYTQFLRDKQLTTRKESLAIQFKLSQAYEQTQQTHLAFQACQNYLNSFITFQEKNYDELLEIIKRLLRLNIYQFSLYRNDLQKVLSAITSLDIAEPMRYEIIYYTSLAIAKAGLSELAAQWLANTFQFGKTSSLKARALYFQGLIAASLARWGKAEELLQAALDHEEHQPSKLRPYCYLTLARVLGYRHKPESALQWYEKITSDLPIYKHALYEKTFLLFQLRQFKKARTVAGLFLSRYPEDPLGQQLKPLMPYFGMRAEDYAIAQTEILATNKMLHEINLNLDRKFRHLIKVDEQILRDLVATVQDTTAPTPLITAGLSLYEQAASEALALERLQGQIRGITHVLSRLTLPRAFPELYQRNLQVLALGKQNLEIGHRFVAIERGLYQSRLSQPDALRLDHLWQHRQGLLEEKQRFYRDEQSSRFFQQFIHLTNKLVPVWQHLQTMRAKLISSQYLMRHRSLPSLLSQKPRIREAEKKVAQLEARLASILTAARRERLGQLATEMSQQGERLFLNRYGLLLQEELSILRSYVQASSGSVDRLLIRDLSEIQQKWVFVMKQIYEILASLEGDVHKEVEQLLSQLSEMQKTSQELNFKLGVLRRQVGKEMTLALHPMLAHYQTAIGERLARNKSWYADMKWTEYQNIQQSKSRLDTQYQMDKEIMENHLYRLQHGVLEP